MFLESNLTDLVFSHGLVLARIGMILLLMPAVGGAFFHQRAKWLLALAVTVAVTPFLKPDLPAMPTHLLTVAILLVNELLIGAFIGFVARILFMSLDVAGSVIAFQISLSNAFAFNPASQHGSVIGSLIGMLAILLIFLLNIHHMFLESMVQSYKLFEVGSVPNMADMSSVITRTVANMFIIGLKMASPFIVIGLMYYAALGLLTRLVPQIQVFFVVIPLQISLGFFMIMLGLSAGMLWFLENLRTSYQQAFVGL